MYKNLILARKLFVKQFQSGFSLAQRVNQNFLSRNGVGGVKRFPMSMMATPEGKEIVPDGRQISDETFIRNYTTNSIEPPSTRIAPVKDEDMGSYEAIDINPWADMERDEAGDGDGKEPKDIGAEYDFRGREYPPIPEKRAGEYQFKGIKIVLPRKLLGEGTYRYCLDKDDEGMADDIRVIRYERN